MSKHTPGPKDYDQPVTRGEKCGCDIQGDGSLQSPLRIVYCAKHAAAPELAEKGHNLLFALNADYHNTNEAGYWKAVNEFSAALRKAGAK